MRKMNNDDTQFVIYCKSSLRIVGLTPQKDLPEQYATGLVELRDGKVTTDPPGLWVSYALPQTVNKLTREILK